MKLSLQAYSNAMQFNDRPQASSHFFNQQTNQHLTAAREHSMHQQARQSPDSRTDRQTTESVRARDRWDQGGSNRQTHKTDKQSKTEALCSAGWTQLL